MVRQLLLIIGFVLVCGSAYADGYISCDSSDGWSYDAVNGWMETGDLTTDLRVLLATGHGTQTMSQSASGYTGECCKVDVTAYGIDGDWKIYPLYKAASGCIFQNGAGYNRAYFYVKVPKLTGTDRYTFHFGTYSKDPTIGKCECSNDGNHFYHYYERIIGSSDYWMKVYVDLHPQHEVNEKTDPGNNPTMNKATTCYPYNFATEGWDYFAGMTRAYWEMKYSPWDNNEAVWSAYTCYFDDYTWYNETYDENTTSINSVLIEYWGDGHFRLNWAGVSQYVEHTQRYEVKYSTSQITSENWASASYPSDMPSGGYGAENVGHYNNDYHAEFTIAGFNEDTTIYFAIKDITPGGDDRLKRVDYLVSGESGDPDPDTTPPIVTITTGDPIATSTDSAEIAWTDSDDTGVTSRKWRIGSAPDATHGTECTSPATVTGLSVGSNTVYIGAGDAAGNWGSDSITVNYSPVATTISIINSGIRGGGGVR